jgi:hypothetical protein
MWNSQYLQFLCWYPDIIWGTATITQLPFETQPLFKVSETHPVFTISLLVSRYYLRHSHYYPATIWDPATIYSFWDSASIYNFCASIQKLFETQLLSAIPILLPTYYLRFSYYLQFLCQYPCIIQVLVCKHLWYVLLKQLCFLCKKLTTVPHLTV